jgi:hypothetical protein
VKKRLITELREKNPGLSARARGGSRQAAIRLFCLECMGGYRPEIKRCTDRECALWSFRMGGKMEKLEDEPRS